MEIVLLPHQKSLFLLTCISWNIVKPYAISSHHFVLFDQFQCWLHRIFLNDCLIFLHFFAGIDVILVHSHPIHCFTESTHVGRVCPPQWVHSTLTLSDITIIFYSCLHHLYSFWIWVSTPHILPPLAFFICFAKVSVDTI